jgi:hypothetical protein
MAEQRKSAEEYRQDAQKSRKAQAESFERSDTDGFLSQWASGHTRRLANARAKIQENDGKSEFNGLYQGDRRVKAQLLEGEWGYYWLLEESEVELIEQRGKPFLPSGPKSRVLKKLGLCERREIAPAWAVMGGKGHGLSGSVWVQVYRDGDRWGQDAELLPENAES